MKIFSTYSVKIKHYNKIFSETVSVYRDAVDFLMDICLSEWADIGIIKGNQAQMMYVESLCHKTKENPAPKYDFDGKFYKMPSYIFFKRFLFINKFLNFIFSKISLTSFICYFYIFYRFRWSFRNTLLSYKS